MKDMVAGGYGVFGFVYMIFYFEGGKIFNFEAAIIWPGVRGCRCKHISVETGVAR